MRVLVCVSVCVRMCVGKVIELNICSSNPAKLAPN